MQWVLDLRNTIDIPNDLAAIGIDDKKLEALGHMAVTDASSGTNPVQHSPAAYTAIVTNALRGELKAI